jgi:hypothetical protein
MKKSILLVERKHKSYNNEEEGTLFTLPLLLTYLFHNFLS